MVMAGFVTVLLCSNLIGPGKQCRVELPFTLPWIGTVLLFPAGNLFFPFAYIFGDVLTEVYGYAQARKVIWAGFGAMLFASLMAWVVVHMPPNLADSYVRELQPGLEMVFGSTLRIAIASPLAYWCGDFVNSYVLARLKVLTRGRWLWTRTIGSTIVGQGVDSLIFYPLAFYGLWQNQTLVNIVLINWAVKVGVEIVMTPLTYVIVSGLKRAENEDFYDVQTNFSPFRLNE
jgi:hypothetical protein